MKYKLKLVETNSKEIEVEADDFDKAWDKAEDIIFEGDIKFGQPEDFQGWELYKI